MVHADVTRVRTKTDLGQTGEEQAAAKDASGTGHLGRIPYSTPFLVLLVKFIPIEFFSFQLGRSSRDTLLLRIRVGQLLL